MKVIPEQDIDIPSIVSSLDKGAVIVYPTETCYGLGCDATDAAAVKKIFDIKQRQQEKSVLVLFPDHHMAMKYV
ncbi:MAG: hypothetical protein COU33_03880, partial [Candidatus Magasanikbacteria bacterium CG10_big_fil_rev_8_21_14_0_10_43_6]